MLLDPLGWELGKDTAKMICLCLTVCRASPGDSSNDWGYNLEAFSLICLVPEQQLRTQTGSSEWAECSGEWVYRVGLLRTGTMEGQAVMVGWLQGDGLRLLWGLTRVPPYTLDFLTTGWLQSRRTFYMAVYGSKSKHSSKWKLQELLWPTVRSHIASLLPESPG